MKKIQAKKQKKLKVFTKDAEWLNKLRKQVKKWRRGRVFVIVLMRWGNPDDHTYLDCVCSSYVKALREARKSMVWRGGKYDAQIYECYLDSGWTKSYRLIHWGDFKPSEKDE